MGGVGRNPPVFVSQENVEAQLRRRRLQTWSEAKELADRSLDADRVFTAEERERWDALNQELNVLDHRLRDVYTTDEARWLLRTPGPRTAPNRLCRYCKHVARGDKCQNCGAPQSQ